MKDKSNFENELPDKEGQELTLEQLCWRYISKDLRTSRFRLYSSLTPSYSLAPMLRRRGKPISMLYYLSLNGLLMTYDLDIHQRMQN